MPQRSRNCHRRDEELRLGLSNSGYYRLRRNDLGNRQQGLAVGQEAGVRHLHHLDGPREVMPGIRWRQIPAILGNSGQRRNGEE